MVNYLLVAHLLGASIWTGGHLILATVVLPKVLVTNDIAALMAFERKFEKIGMPALLLQIATGLGLVYRILPDPSMWFGFNQFADNDLSILITAKISLLMLTLLIALHARFKVIPKLEAPHSSTSTLRFFAIHIIAVTLLSVTFMIVGSLFRTGLV